MSRALEGQRMMTKDVPSCITAFSGVSNQFEGVNGWDNDTNGTLYYESYFDLSGYELSDLTTLIEMLQLQDSNAYYLLNPGPDSIITLVDVISEERLSPDTVSDLAQNGEYPGTMGSKQDFEQIKYCTVRGMLPQTDFASQTLLVNGYGGGYGSASPTTASKLWIYRIVRIGGTDLTGQTIVIPATRFIMGANIVKEAELPYLMRLKRSFELGTD